jgi:hypothetical protein
MSVKLATLKTEITEIADRLEALTGLESRSVTDEKEIDALTTRSEEARVELEREEDLQKRMAGLRAVAGRSSPRTTPANAPAPPNAPHPVQPGQYHYRELSCFPGPNGERDAYRAGQFFLATIYGVESAKRSSSENGIFSRALPADGQVEGDPERGGNLTNPEFLSTILRNVDQYGTFPREAFRQPMKSHTPIKRPENSAVPRGNQRHRGTDCVRPCPIVFAASHHAYGSMTSFAGGRLSRKTRP